MNYHSASELMNVLVKRYNLPAPRIQQANPLPKVLASKSPTEDHSLAKEIKLLQEKLEKSKEENQLLKQTIKKQNSELE